MSIPAGKERRQITLSKDTWAYIDSLVAEEKAKRWYDRKEGHITGSSFIEQIIQADKTVKDAFGQK